MAPRAPLINLKDIRLQDGAKPLFEGVTFSLEPRVRACLVGRNGAGKSTLLKLAAGWVEPDSGERTISPGARIAFVPQEPLVEGATLRDYATSGGAETYVAESELWEVGMDPDRPAAGLSGGEIRRAALAKAFAEDPDLLLLDEPTNHLDIIAIEALQTKIKGTRAAVLAISHDRAFLEAITGRCLWLWSRKVRVRDEGFAGFDAWMEAEMAAEAESLRRLEKAIERETYTFYRSITAQRTRNEGRARNLNAMRLDKAERVRDLPRQLEMAMETGANSGKLICDVKKVSKAFGERVILKDFSLRLLRGDRLAIVGPNGAGKSTLLKILLGELAPDSGEVKLGANLTPAYLDQTRQSLNDAETLWEALAPSGDQVMVRGTPKHVAAYAKDFLFSEAQLRQPVSTLSGGERNRLQLARAIAKPANVMVLDEPTNDLDMDTLDLLEAMLADYDGTLILVSHDRDFVDRLATSTLALNGRGEAAESPGGYSDFIRQNPDFFTGPKAAPAKKASASTVKPEPKKAVKLTYKEQRRLEELAQLVDSLPLKILATENKLHAPNFYAKDPNGFAKMTKALEQLKAELEACELEWLELEDKRAQLAN